MLPTQVRICDIAKLFLETLAPWEPLNQFIQDCMEADEILKDHKKVSLQNNRIF